MVVGKNRATPGKSSSLTFSISGRDALGGGFIFLRKKTTMTAAKAPKGRLIQKQRRHVTYCVKTPPSLNEYRYVSMQSAVLR